MGMNEPLGAAARRDCEGLPSGDQLLPGQAGGTGVEVIRVEGREIADRLEDAQRRPQLEARPQRDLALAGEARAADAGADALRAERAQLSFQRWLGAARTGRVPRAEHSARNLPRPK